MKKIRFLFLLFAAMFCSNVLYAQTYLMNSENNVVLFSITESNKIYLGDVRGDNSQYMGEFEKNTFKLPPKFFKNTSYKNAYLAYLDGNTGVLVLRDKPGWLNEDIVRIYKGETEIYNSDWKLYNKKVGNEVFSPEGKLISQYTGPVPDKIHAVISFLTIMMPY